MTLQQDDNSPRDDVKSLDIFVATETWHHSIADVSLRLATRADYRVADAIREADPGHSGVAVFYRQHCKSNRVTLPCVSSFEGLCLRLFNQSKHICKAP